MIHYVLLTRDDSGRNVVDTRVIDVDRSDGLDTAGRVNAGIDLMLGAARDGGLSVGPIGVSSRTGPQRRELRSRGSGPRRQIHLVDEDAAIVEYLSSTGQIDRFGSVVVVDCGDTGMSVFTVDPATKRISDVQRSKVLSGQQLDRAIVRWLAVDETVGEGGLRTRQQRTALLSVCRTAKEELANAGTGDAESILLADGAGRVSLTAATVESAAAPMVAEARTLLEHYVGDARARGGRPPEAVVFVGGLANLPIVGSMAGTSFGEVVRPESPELAAATGAAILARASAGLTTRLAFIGGRRPRQWLSAAPLAVVGAILAAALMTVYAVSSSLTGQSGPAPSPAPTSVATSEATAEQESSSQPAVATTVAPPTTELPDVQLPVPTTVAPAPRTEQRWNDSPGWATTELPPSTPPTTDTKTLSPYPLPAIPWPEGQPAPTIPRGWLPEGWAPPTTTAPQTPRPPQLSPTREQAPGGQAQNGQAQSGQAPEGRSAAPRAPEARAPQTSTSGAGVPSVPAPR
ncbi:Hsp70 family protein [Gordonia soli]|uniref:Chaperone protein n=1 Tax=Gordonia soli NBRC 108243 TaxID=1223545 RepID=M0QN64_9ACTN|nr:Hsp70 family protein [Gordonia soli]GAC69844.1 hypothetical protein GS4_28_00920 [Gordonia soli NBRC 108243]